MDIDIVLSPQEGVVENLSQKLADAAADVFGSSQAETRVKIWPGDAANYAENCVTPGNACNPIFIDVLQAKLKTGQALKDEVKHLKK